MNTKKTKIHLPVGQVSNRILVEDTEMIAQAGWRCSSRASCRPSSKVALPPGSFGGMLRICRFVPALKRMMYFSYAELICFSKNISHDVCRNDEPAQCRHFRQGVWEGGRDLLNMHAVTVVVEGSEGRH